MPLGKNLEELLKSMDPAVAKAQRDFWEANPAIAAAIETGAVPQAVFSRELNAKDVLVKAAQQSAQEIKEWEKRERPKFDKVVKDLEQTERERDDLKRRVDEAAAHRPGDPADVSADELQKRVEERLAGRMVTDDRLKAIMKEEREGLMKEMVTTLDNARKEFLEKTFPMATNFQADLVEVMQDHFNETGKKMDRKAFSDFMQEHKIIDPKEAYERMMAPVRKEKEINAEVEKRVADRMGKMNVPGVTPGQSQATELGPLQLHISGETPKFRDGGALGDHEAGNLAAKEMRAEGLF